MGRSFMKEVRGLQAVGARGRILGEIVDLEVESNGEVKVTAVVLRVSPAVADELGLKKHFLRAVTLPVPIEEVVCVADMVMLKLSLKEFAALLRTAKAIDEREAARKAVKPTPARGGEKDASAKDAA